MEKYIKIAEKIYREKYSDSEFLILVYYSISSNEISYFSHRS